MPVEAVLKVMTPELVQHTVSVVLLGRCENYNFELKRKPSQEFNAVRPDSEELATRIVVDQSLV